MLFYIDKGSKHISEEKKTNFVACTWHLDTVYNNNGVGYTASEKSVRTNAVWTQYVFLFQLFLVHTVQDAGAGMLCLVRPCSETFAYIYVKVKQSLLQAYVA